MNKTLNIKKIPNNIEKFIINHINFNPPNCYKKPSNQELRAYNDLFINENIQKYNINLNTILSIRSSFVKEKIIKNHHKLVQKISKILDDYENNNDILFISKKYDGSPLNILRLIFNQKYEISPKNLFKNPSLLNKHDKKQLKIAIENDDFGLINQDNILKESELFEKDIENILIKNKVIFKTQNELIEEQKIKFGNPICTPDFLIESKFIINNISINWIDAKNFYGSNTSFIKKSIEKQTEKYIKAFGEGAIIFKYGFNEEIEKINDKILFIDFESFKKIN